MLTHEHVRVDLERVAGAVGDTMRDFGDYVREAAAILSALQRQ